MAAEYPTGGRLTQKAIDRPYLTAFMCAPRYDDDFRARRHVLYEFGELEPIIGPGHVHVGDDEIERRAGADQIDSLGRVCRQPDMISLLGQVLSEVNPDYRLIVDDKYPRHAYLLRRP